jgi:hypothetical protein
MNAMNRRPSNSLLRMSLAALAGVSLSSFVAAQDEHWRWSVTPYVWATDVGVDVRLDGREVVDETIPVEDLLEDIDATFQGRIEAKRGEHGFMLDVFHVSMSDEVNGFPLPMGAGQGDLSWKMDMTIADVAGIYDPEGDDLGFQFLYGLRVIDQRAEVDAIFTTSRGSVPHDYDGSDTLVDVLAGVRFSNDLTERLRFQTQLDFSTGGTEFSWSAFPSLRYAFGDGYGLVAGYRTMTVDFEDEGGRDSEMTLSGPVLGFQISL